MQSIDLVENPKFAGERNCMNRRVCLYPGLIIGVVVDGILRLASGDEGNLLVHAAVFLGSAVIAMLIINGFLKLRKRVKKK